MGNCRIRGLPWPRTTMRRVGRRVAPSSLPSCRSRWKKPTSALAGSTSSSPLGSSRENAWHHSSRRPRSCSPSSQPRQDGQRQALDHQIAQSTINRRFVNLEIDSLNCRLPIHATVSRLAIGHLAMRPIYLFGATRFNSSLKCWTTMTSGRPVPSGILIITNRLPSAERS